MGLRPLYAGMIYGSVPVIHRDAGRGLCTFGSVPRYTGIWPGIIYIHITQNIYMCVHTSCLSHARVVPILDVPTVPRVRDQ